MADLTQTAANVGLSGKNANTSTFQAGEALTQGQPFYKKASDGKYYRTDADASESATALGIVLTSAATNGYFLGALPGSIVDLGATLIVGETYCVSTNVGGIAPIGDLTTGDYVAHLGVASAADTITLNILVSGIAKP